MGGSGTFLSGIPSNKFKQLWKYAEDGVVGFLILSEELNKQVRHSTHLDLILVLDPILALRRLGACH